ncbi:TPA: hypothetical protein N0F65_009640 [Lagenidium giganteum]|uniref:Protein prenyltransferase alpha subunit repeat-containing protein 1 n=1 Tax=Lagenidium giganteum TaxID=4803 RepID=A0AAV2YK66_9STRA|nr:TPA: hypothetical protein N0F65_009640 [Lagenidium giganteum]
MASTSLLERVNELFAEDPDIDEIGLVFGLEEADVTAENAFVLEEHKLGVAFAAGAALFREARTLFHPLNAKWRVVQGAMDGEQQQSVLSPDEQNRLLACTRSMLLICADCYTAWNTRKAFVVAGKLTTAQEIKFCNLVLSLHPKSIDTWAYRRWLATRLVTSQCDDAELRCFFQQQVELCALLAERQARNYHAWSFRHWIVVKFPDDMLRAELETMSHWCKTHLMDHSGWNHRQYVLEVLLDRMNDRGDASALLFAEYHFLSELMVSYLTHEALWCHRRFVIQKLFDVLQEDINVTLDTMAPIQQRVRDMHAVLLEVDRSDQVAEPASVWTRLQTKLTSQETPAAQKLALLFEEVECAWATPHKFARRYALWTLEILARLLSPFSLSAELSKALRQQLAIEEPLLANLWLAGA